MNNKFFSFKYPKNQTIQQKFILDNKLKITNEIELSKIEEKITKQKAYELFNSDKFDNLLKTAGSFENLRQIHYFLFSDIYDWAGQIRQINISKNNFTFANCSYLDINLQKIEQMPQNDFINIIKKYVEMNIAHPFREGNGRAMRLWLDLIIKKELNKIIDWQQISKQDYLLAMERSPIKDIEIRYLILDALIDDTNDKKVYMRNFDVSSFYEGLADFKTENIKDI